MRPRCWASPAPGSWSGRCSRSGSGPDLPPRGFASPYFDQLDEPGRLLSELTFTGYYPVVPWLAYLLVGMAIGRMDLTARRVQLWLAGGGP